MRYLFLFAIGINLVLLVLLFSTEGSGLPGIRRHKVHVIDGEFLRDSKEVNQRITASSRCVLFSGFYDVKEAARFKFFLSEFSVGSYILSRPVLNKTPTTYRIFVGINDEEVLKYRLHKDVVFRNMKSNFPHIRTLEKVNKDEC